MTTPWPDYERSQRGCRVWWCPQCGAYNKFVVKRIFKIPLFKCMNIRCNEEYLWQHDLDVSLADVKVNGLPLVPSIFEQEGQQVVDPNHPMRTLNQSMLCTKYYRQYPGHVKIGTPNGPCVEHKLLKMLHELRKVGITTKSCQYKVGDVTFKDKGNYDAICAELANGVPLLARIIPGHFLQKLKYGQFYMPPSLSNTTLEKLRTCSLLHKEYPHSSHVVVLVGPGTNHETKERGFWAVNSWPNWCVRKELPGFTDGFVEHGVGLIPHSALITNVVKLWQPGQSAPWDSFRLVDERDDLGDMSVKARNLYMLLGDLTKAIPEPFNDPRVTYCPDRNPFNPFFV